MTEREAFKLGFLQYVADQGMTPSAFQKQAEECTAVKETTHEKQAGYVADAAKMITAPADLAAKGVAGAAGAGGSALKYLAAIAVLTPIIGGFTTGKVHSMLTDVGPGDLDRLKQRQLSSEYRRQARRITGRSEQEGWRSLFKKRKSRQKEEDLFGA